MIKSERVKQAFRTPYVYLLAFSVVVGAIYSLEVSYLQSSELLRVWTGRVAAASLGSYLTAVLVDSSFRHKEERERKRRRKIALEQLSGAINAHLGLLGNWYIAPLDDYPKNPPKSYQEFLNPEYIEKVQMVDFSKSYPTASPSPDPTWLEISGHQLESFSENVDDVISKYGMFLEPSMLQTLRELSQSPIASLCQTNLVEFDRRKSIDRDYNLLAGTNMEHHLANHLFNLLEVINWYSETDGVHIKPVNELDAWKEDVSPNPGSAKLEKSVEESEPLFGMGPSYPEEEYHGSSH